MTNFKTGGPWVTRFAPSPTGEPHLGNVRTAVLNFLLARQSGGTFLLRLEDTDQERSTFGFEASILGALAWLGLTPDQPARHQSLRLHLYRQTVDRLAEADRAYPCFCSEAELERERAEAAARNLPPRYSGRCAALSADERAARIKSGEPHVMRFRLPDQADIAFTDLIKGEIRVPAGAFGDFVLLRSDGWPSYNLAVVVDDADMGVNLVLRGEDHLTNTARQLLLYAALGFTPPHFAHHGLLVDPEGKKLSKRSGAPGIRDCMRDGLDPLAVVHYLGSLSGALPTKNIFSSVQDMARAFNPFALGRGNAVMNVDELRALSARYFRAADPEDQLRALDSTLPPNDPWHELETQLRLDLVTGLRENAATLDELRSLLPHFTASEVRYTATALAEMAGGLDVLHALADALEGLDPQSRLTAKEASALLGQTATRAGAKGRALYHPIRLALTGSGSGPELSALLTLLTVGRLRERIQAAIPSFPSTTKE
jgi:glutamyl-tRNA synthetase/nondiscriminating glutamyl-tRNA synthetase